MLEDRNAPNGLGNSSPFAADDWFDLLHDTTLFANLLWNDYDPDGDTLSITRINGQTYTPGTQIALQDGDLIYGYLTVEQDGNFTFTPTLRYKGQVSFSYTISDGEYESTAWVTINVFNNMPQLGDQEFSMLHDRDLVGNLLSGAYDPDGDAIRIAHINGQAISYGEPVSLPSGGSLTVWADGTFSYTPPPNFTGTDSFSLTISDDLDSYTAMVNILITNNAPYAYDASFSVLHNRELVGQLSGYDPDGDAITAQLVTGPTHGTLTFNADGTFTYTPNTHYAGPDSFTYIWSDGLEGSNIGTVTIDVYNNEPLVYPPDLVIAHGELFEGDLSDYVIDRDGDELAFEVVLESLHAAAFHLNADGSFMYLPEPGWTGVDSFVFSVTDGAAAVVAVAYVSVVNEHPWASDDFLAFNPSESGSLFRFHVSELLANDFDPDTPPSRWQIHLVPDSGPTHGNLTFDPETGYFSYMVDPGFEGIDFFSYYITDGVPRTDWSPGVLDHLREEATFGIDTSYTTSNVARVAIRVGNPESAFLNENGDGGANQQALETVELVFFTFIPEPEVSINIPLIGPVSRFKGDNRGFSQSPGTETAFRTKQYVKIEFTDVIKNKYRVSEKYARVGETRKINEKGEVEATGYADPKWDTQVKTFYGGRQGNFYVIDVEFSMSAGNPLVLCAPKIDYRARLQLTTYNTEDSRRANLTNWWKHFWVTVDGFPNYEAYLRINGGQWINVYTHDHGNETPWALYGNAGDYTRGGYAHQWPLSSIGNR
jgi:VCBS repeat-containing protein